MTALAFLLILVGIGAIIEGYHGKPFWQDLTSLFSGQAPTGKKA